MAIDGAQQTKFTVLATREDNQLVFVDPNQQRYRFQLREDEIHLFRTGAEELDLLFQAGKKTSGTVKLEGFQFVTDVHTRKLKLSNGALSLEYDLLDGSKTLSSHTLNLAWTQTNGRN